MDKSVVENLRAFRFRCKRASADDGILKKKRESEIVDSTFESVRSPKANIKQPSKFKELSTRI